MRRRIIAAVITALLAIGIFTVASLGYREITGPHSLTAVFPKTTGIYVGDDVRVAGVKVGTITGIHPQGTTVRMTMDIDRGVKVPTGAKAVIIAQNLVANRYVQLTPSYRGTGTTLADGAIIPLGRTEIPVEWDEIKKQLTRLATDLGPDEKDAARNPDSVVGRFIGAAADTLDGNGESMSSALRELTDLSRLLGENTGNITTTISNLSLLVKAVSSSSEQITSFEHRLATVSSVLDGSRTDIDSALTTLARAVADVRRFVVANRDGASEQVRRLAAVTQNLVDSDDSIEQLLHAFPNNLSNFYNIYSPDTGTQAGVFVVNNFSNPIQFVCSSIASIENLTAAEGAAKCRKYLGPILSMLSFNYLPFPLNPVLGPDPENVIYSEKRLIPGNSDSGGSTKPAKSRRELLLPGQGGR
ncbi:MCE family protein [Gordonia amarae]|uniref:Mce family protein n=2 Tax=Gordonia amarae TaxID=36821 RepID=G7GKE4_9ACTN|nr:MCE family protein [Gordonia amarae]MCS3880434.1 virulence factor Mce-like protein [Gordonia amarae]QHN18768.1 MCE family protein [Gordonia amarae]QHN23243.1 MCE family protein [Gordonia amarae]QHN32145.1 MCE family protein [Gordonia amarae]QHN40891.1 MCE family protein [Gordonia amarae]